MAFVLYKEGDTDEVNGIKCTIEHCPDVSLLKSMWDAGYKSTPEELYQDRKSTIKKKAKQCQENSK
jgi:hypothetical protein